MRTQLMIALAGLTLATTACGTTAADPPKQTTPPATVAPATTVAVTTVAVAPTTSAVASVNADGGASRGSDVAVKSATSPLGQILVDAQGRTLYAFLNDVNFQSTCTGTCADAWPPIIVGTNWDVAPGLDSGIFSTTVRADDGKEQLMIGRFPLYYFSGDAKPGDVNGQGSGDVWFVIGSDAKPIQGAGGATASASTTSATSAPPVAVGTTEQGSRAGAGAADAPAPLVTTSGSGIGTILVDGGGRTVYGFTKDAGGVPTCLDGCAKAWPPVLVSDDAAKALADGTLDKSLFTTVDRPDGTKQLKAGKWPLYYFSGDTAAGQTNGQGSGTSWFVIGADAKLIKS